MVSSGHDVSITERGASRQTEFAKSGNFSRPAERSKCRTTRYSCAPLAATVRTIGSAPLGERVLDLARSGRLRRKTISSPWTSTRSVARPDTAEAPDFVEPTELLLLLAADGVRWSAAPPAGDAAVSWSRAAESGDWMPNFLAASKAGVGSDGASGSA